MIFIRKIIVSAACFARTARPKSFFLFLFFTLLIGCRTTTDPKLDSAKAVEVLPPKNTDKLFVVDCLLPEQTAEPGAQATDTATRRSIKTIAGECETKGGEYVAYDRANVESALKIWLPQAQQGDAEAQVIVGEIYEKGLGGIVDLAQAVQWYSKAAKQGNSRAQVNLGYLYEKGRGVKKNTRTALNWYRKASGLANASLQFEYVTGESQEEIDRKRRQARAWNKASGSAYESGRQQQLAQSRQKLDQLRERLKQMEAEYHDTFARIKTVIEGKALRTGSAQEKRAYEKLHDNLQQDKDKLLAQGQQIKKLKETIEQEQQTLASLENAPVIDIIEPVMTLTRGVPSHQLKSGVRSKKIVGRISAPDSLKTLRINEQAVPVDADGTFRSNIAIASDLTSVKIVAIDKQGNRSVEAFNILANDPEKANNGKKLSIEASLKPYSSVDFGQFHALIIGNSDHEQLPTLQTSVNDAKAVDEMLRTRYGYETTLLTNASQHQIMEAFDELRKQLTEKDNLLIYYAGHGEIDKTDQTAYWLPSDADPANNATWLSSHNIAQYLSILPAKHILVIADSCFSGTLTKTSIASLPEEMSPKNRKKWVSYMNKRKGRTVLASGDVKPIPAPGLSDGSHSIFTNAFLKVLGDNVGLLKDYELYRIISDKVKKSTSQIIFPQSPQYSVIQHAGHEGSPFFFVPKSQ